MSSITNIREYIARAIPRYRLLQLLYTFYLNLIDIKKRLFKKKRTIKYAGKTIAFESMNYEKFKSKLNDYLKFVKELPEDIPFIVMFSGTIYMQEERANRPIRLSKIYIERGFPVLFSYFRWKKDDEIPGNFSDLLFQSPIDFTLLSMNYLAQYDLGKRLKIFFVSFPYIEITKYINQLELNSWTTFYDARDDWEEFQKVGMAKWYNKYAETYIVNNCDQTFAVSNPLRIKLQETSSRKRIHLSPNAYDSSFLRIKPDKSSRAGNKIAGYFGHLTDKWFDWPALIQIATIRADWTFEIIGHGQPKNLTLPENIKLLGKKNHKDINNIASRWNVAMIIFKINELSAAVDPIKIYEYLALELPTVSFVMPQIHDYPYTFIAETPEEFADLLDQARQVDIEYENIWRFIEMNNWEHRASQFIEEAKKLNKNSLSFTELLLS